MRTEMTQPEAKLWAALRGNRIGIKFQRQVVLAPYIADFAARAERLIVEVDGDTHAASQAYDEARTAALEARGYRVMRFTNGEVLHNLAGVLRVILIELGRDPEASFPLSQPSPPEG